MTNRVVIRGFASGVTHWADVHERSLQPLTSFGVPCTGSLTPLAALCRAQVGRGRGVVVMQEGSRVSCTTCKRFAA